MRDAVVVVVPASIPLPLLLPVYLSHSLLHTPLRNASSLSDSLPYISIYPLPQPHLTLCLTLFGPCFAPLLASKPFPHPITLMPISYTRIPSQLVSRVLLCLGVVIVG